ncbi:MAG: orotate phosphoribosyltransferase [Pelagibacteraceae bacterium]|nr:orotate phosphoribosyltransferase [Pelagibacteraceae bacterium]
MLSYKESLKILKETNALLEGHFILSSGLHSEKYIQCAQLLSKPKKAKFICESLAEKIRKNFKKIDLLLSPAMGGIIIGYEIGRILNIETIFAERVNEIFSLRRDFKINKGQKILILEDVITTGKSSLECSNLATQMGAEIVGYACLIDRSAGTTNIDKKIISQVEIQIPTYSEENLPKHLKGIKAIKPGSRNL